MDSFISTSKKLNIAEGLKRGIRQDGRNLLDSRPLKILFNHENEGVEVDLGQTKVLAKMTANVTEPRLDRQNEGFIIIRADISALNTSMPGKNLRDMSDEIVKVLEKSIKGSKLAYKSDRRRVLEHKDWQVLLGD
jgi:exosome complex component RRP45